MFMHCFREKLLIYGLKDMHNKIVSLYLYICALTKFSPNAKLSCSSKR